MSHRTAAALLLSRGSGAAEVFLAERAPELRFFGGYFALPGGTLTDEDRALAGGDETAALLHCAHRELFEETGLLCFVPPTDLADRDRLVALRQRLIASEQDGAVQSPWRELAAAAEPPALTELCRVETPPFAPVRYDTAFFHVPLESCTTGTAGVTPDIWPGELTSGRFFRPADALAAFRRGEILLVPPVVILLEHLVAAADFDAFRAELAATTAGYRSGRLHQVRFSPGVVLAPLRTPTLPPATTTNCYVIGQDELWIVDPGSPEPVEQERLLALLDELCQPRTDGSRPRLGGILSTHHHVDHVGGLAPLCRARGLAVRGHPLTLERLPPGVAIGAPLQHGDRLELGTAPDGSAGWHLTAFHTPGHDRGHLCFEESRYGAMLVGDMMSTVSTIIVDPPEGHLATYLESLEALLQRPLTTLYPAHGPAMRDGTRLVRQYLRHRRQREAALVQALQQAPATVEELLPKVYWDVDPGLYLFAARSLLAGLQKLEEEGRAAFDLHRWLWVAP